jgi:hypothetical protein
LVKIKRVEETLIANLNTVVDNNKDGKTKKSLAFSKNKTVRIINNPAVILISIKKSSKKVGNSIISINKTTTTPIASTTEGCKRKFKRLGIFLS